MFKTIEDFVGNTPLVKLKHLPGVTSNTVLVKLEGNNPAGSVKDRPALSMITHAQERGDIRPGDTLIEATSGNTGIALAMAAAIMGYPLILVMPEHLSIERRQSMRAYGAEIVLTSKEGGMEEARDVAERMRDEGRGIILDQFANPDNPRAHYEGTVLRSGGIPGEDYAFREQHGHYRYNHGLLQIFQGKKPGNSDHRGAAGGRCADSGHPQMA